MMRKLNKPLCPSVSYDSPGANIFGVITGSIEQPEVVFLDNPEPVTDEILTLAKPVSPEAVFRICSPCSKGECGYFNSENNRCHLVEKNVESLPKVVDKLPICSIRAECKWWGQEGKNACLYCPQVDTFKLLNLQS